ncbi:MAG: tetratricopeptide repeat protein [Vicinamibacterales bacterium]
MLRVLPLLLVALTLAASSTAQPTVDRDRARVQVRNGWREMDREDWAAAARDFQRATDIDRTFEDAFYGLGLAKVRLKHYGEAVLAYVKCRDLYRAHAGRRFSSEQDAQQHRRDRMVEIDDAIRQTQQGPQNVRAQERLRQLQEQRRQLQEAIRRGNDVTLGSDVPGYVYLGLGSAFFRLEQWEDAEREFKSAIEADGKLGEAYNNLAVVYLTTGRPAEAEHAVTSAEKAGYRVSPGLKDEIKKNRS